jgi:hypothetical protein
MAKRIGKQGGNNTAKGFGTQPILKIIIIIEIIDVGRA